MAAIALVATVPRLTRWASLSETSGNQQPALVLGHLQKVEGKVSWRDLGQSQFSEVSAQADLMNLGSLQVQTRGRAELTFNSGYEIALPERSLVVFELHDPSDSKSPVYLHVLSGRPELLKEGKPGSLYILIDNQLLDPKGVGTLTAREMVISPLLVEGATAAATENLTPTLSATAATATPSLAASGAPTATANDTDPNTGTLSNDYIDEVIAQQAEQFQRCQANALRLHGEAKGKMLIGLTISPQGKIEEARVLTTNIQDEAMHKCVVQVFDRVKMKPFVGAPIVRSYPLNFE